MTEYNFTHFGHRVKLTINDQTGAISLIEPDRFGQYPFYFNRGDVTLAMLAADEAGAGAVVVSLAREYLRDFINDGSGR